jgi:hypothetical protein
MLHENGHGANVSANMRNNAIANANVDLRLNTIPIDVRFLLSDSRRKYKAEIENGESESEAENSVWCNLCRPKRMTACL